MPAIRRPAVAGIFYAGDEASLRQQIQWCADHRIGPGDRWDGPRPADRPFALISPHAGYRYSGPIAAHTYAALPAGAPELAVILGPNHHMLGASIALSGMVAWQTPLGAAVVDLAATAELCALYPEAVVDDLAHQLEHSIEVQLPFLQCRCEPSLTVMPIALSDQDLSSSMELGHALARLCRDKNALVVASSDFSHYESHEVVTLKDRWATRAIEELDAEGLVEAIRQHRISMCGPGPVIAAIVAARDLGANRGELLRYATSGDSSGDFERVVGYAALALY